MCVSHVLAAVALFDGTRVPASLFRSEDPRCFPQSQEDLEDALEVLGEVVGGLPPFALEGLYYPVLVRYLQVRVCVVAVCVAPCVPCIRSPSPLAQVHASPHSTLCTLHSTLLYSM